MRRLLTIGLLALPALAAAQDTTLGGHITASQALTAAGNPYRVISDVFVEPGVVLTLEAGVVVRFVSGRGLYVDGTLVTAGTEANPVVLTSDSSFTPGIWKGVGLGTGLSRPGDPSAVGQASADLVWTYVQYAGTPGGFPLPGQPNRAAGIFAYRSTISGSKLHVDYSGGDGVYWYCDASPPRSLTLRNGEITSSGADGLNVGFCNSGDAVTVEGNAFLLNAAYPIRLPAAAMGVVSSANTLAGNGPTGDRNGIAVVGGTLASTTTLTPDGLWFILGPLTVPAGGSLAVGPGNTLRFPSNGRLQVNGHLNVNGLADRPTVFTADAAAPSPGFWAGIGLGEGASALITHAAVRYAGYPEGFTVPGLPSGLRTAGFFAYRADLSLAATAIEECGGDAVHWYNGGTGATTRTLSVNGGSMTEVAADGVDIEADTPTDAVSVSGVSFSGIGQYPVRCPFRRAPGLAGVPLVAVTGGAMDRDAALAPSVYHVLAPVSVNAGKALTLPASCRLGFASGAWFDVYGTLFGNGAAGAPVVLTSSAASPAPGAWGGVGLQPGASATLTDTEVLWAGQAGAFFVSGFGGVQAGVVSNRADLNATRLRVANGSGDGVFHYNSGTTARSLSLTDCSLTDNGTDGLRLQRFGTGGDMAVVTRLETARNGGYGVNSVVGGTGVTFSGVTAVGNAKAPARFSADTLPKLTGGSFSANGFDNAVVLTGGALPVSVATPHSLYLESSVTVASAATLTLAPGASLTARPSVSLLVNGGLNAPGTADRPIAFRADGASPWGGVALMPGASGALSHVTFTNGGAPGAYSITPVTNAAAALAAWQASLSLSDAVFTGGSGDGILLVNDSTTPRTLTVSRVSVTAAAKIGVNVYAAPGNEVLSLSSLTVSSCGGVAIAMPFRSLYALGGGNVSAGNSGGDGVAVSGLAGGSGTLSRDVSLPHGTRLLARNYLTVGPGVTLTLPKGSECRFSSGAGLRVDGILNADGAPESSVLFTADSASPAPGYWQSLGFSTNSRGTLTHTEVRYAGSPTSMPGYSAIAGSLIATGADVTMDGCLVRDGAGSNIALRGTSTTFAATRTTLLSSEGPGYVRLVDDAGQGVRSFGGSAPGGCDFLGFSADAVKNTGAATLYARWCFWGMPDGPAPFGGGSGVQGNVDFLPYSSSLVNGPVAVLSGPAWTPNAPVTLTVTASSPYFASATLKTATGETLATFSAPVQGLVFPWDATGVPDGVYTFRLATTDRLGRTATAEWSATVGSGPPHSGDLDANGAVDFADAMLALRVSAGLDTAPSWVAAAADVRPKPGTIGGVGDGFVRLDDAAAIARKAADPGMAWP